MSATIIAIANQKGGTGKTTTAISLAAAEAERGRQVLLVDADHQGSATIGSGFARPDDIDRTLATLMEAVIDRREPDTDAAILHASENFDIIPSNVILSRVDRSLSRVSIGPDRILKRILDPLRSRYDLILIDCAPALNGIAANAFVASDRIIVPTCPQFLSVAGLRLLLSVVAEACDANPRLRVLGALLTMRDPRRRAQGDIEGQLRGLPQLHMLDTVIPRSVKAEEAPAAGRSILSYDPHGPAAAAYRRLADELDGLLAAGEER